MLGGLRFLRGFRGLNPTEDRDPVTKREFRRLLVTGAICTAISVGLTALTWSGQWRTAQASLVDQFFRASPSEDAGKTAKNAVIVAIDDPSIRELGRYGEWPRGYYADVVDRLREGRARGIAFDVGFTEPSADDERVVEALRRFRSDGAVEQSPESPAIERRFVISPVAGASNTIIDSDGRGIPKFPPGIRPTDPYVSASTRLAHANVIPDADGVVRAMPLVIENGDEQLWSLGLAAAASYFRADDLNVRFDPPGVAVGCGPNDARCRTAPGEPERLVALLPTDDRLRMLVSFAGKPSHVSKTNDQPFKVVSLLDVLRGNVDPTIFQDKMVFIGLLDAIGFADDYPVSTSTAPKMWGVEIHANTFATITSFQYFRYQDRFETAILIFLVCFLTGFFIFGLGLVNIFLATGGAIASVVLYYFGSYIYVTGLSDPKGITIPNLLYPPLAVLLTLVATMLYRVVIEGAEVRATRGAMGKYLSPAVLREVMRDPDKLHLGGDKRVMTVLFTDIRGFTSISEQLEPDALVSLLNEYLTVMTDIVHRWHGVLDKYMGDAIMAWWGAPTEQPDHAYRACMTALEMRAALHTLHQSWEDRNVPKLEMGVGVNTGLMVYGNTGSRDRFDFTVLGDAVNLASRLEGANKEYGSNVIISASTRDEVAGRGMVMRSLGVIEVKGKTEPGEIYELLGLESTVDAETRELVAAWESAMGLYRAHEFGLAEDAFRRILAIRPDDGPSLEFSERCVDLNANPPAADWSGVFVMTQK